MSTYDSYVFSLILNWIRWEHVRRDSGKPVNLGYGKSLLVVAGAQSGAADGEREPQRVMHAVPIESLAAKVDALWWKRGAWTRRMLAAWYFQGRRIGSKYLREKEIKSFELDVKGIEI